MAEENYTNGRGGQLYILYASEEFLREQECQARRLVAGKVVLLTAKPGEELFKDSELSLT